MATTIDGIDLRDLAARRLERGFLLAAVEAEDGIALLHLAAHADIDLCHAAAAFGQDRDRPEVGRHVGRRGVIVEHHGDQADRQHEAGRDAPAQLEPDGDRA